MSTIEEAREYDRYGHPYTEDHDCAFLKDAFQAYHGSVREVLDIACGTGRHTVRLSRDGYAVTGVDNDEGMLAAAAEKAAEWKVSVDWVQADMSAMGFASRFDAAYILFNTIIGFTTNDELIRFMEGVHHALRSGGLFIIEVGNYWALMANGELKLGDSRWEKTEADGRKVVRDSTVTLSAVNSYLGFTIHQRSWRDGQEEESKESGGIKRIFSLNELDLLARLTHFEMAGVFGAMDMAQPIEDLYTTAKMENPPRSYVLVLRKR